jgi:capsular exopolysaccharide synthesis family protein
MLETETYAAVPLRSTERARNRDLETYCDSLLGRLHSIGYGRSQPLCTLGLTSCTPGEGVTTIAVNLAIQAAHAGLNVLLIDANLQRPAIERFFCIDARRGFADAVLGHAPLGDCIQRSEIDNLAVLPAGAQARSSAILDPLAVAEMFQAVNRDFDLAVFDLSSINPFSSCVLESKLDGLLLVLEAERVRRDEAEPVKKHLTQSGVNLLGAVFNKRKAHIPRWLYRRI